MRVVLDTNVVISGVFFGGVPGRVLAAWSSSAFVLVVSPAILEEYRRVGRELGRRHPAAAVALEPVLTLVTLHAMLTDASSLADQVCDDPDDDMFLAAADAAHTKIVVSGDQDLLRVSGWHDVTVLTPRQFVDQYIQGRCDTRS